QYEWPGNIRELRNTIERAVLFARRRGSRTIIFDDIVVYGHPDNNTSRMKRIDAEMPCELSDLTPEKFKEFLAVMEREYFKAALEITQGSAVDLATRIGIGRSTIFKYIKQCGITFDGRRVQGPRIETNYTEFGLPGVNAQKGWQ